MPNKVEHGTHLGFRIAPPLNSEDYHVLDENMSQGQIPDYAMNYPTPSPYGNAPMLVKLAGIFNIVVGALTILFAVVQGVWAVFMRAMLTAPTAPSGTTTVWGIPFSTTTTGSPMPGAFQWIFVALYAGAALLDLISGIVEISAGVALVRRSRRSFGWGIAALVASFLSVFSSFFGVCCLVAILPLGSGIYTLVVLCFDNCRRYLRQAAA
jgi:hypothetical protein